LALWSDFVPLLTKAGDELFWRFHTAKINLMTC
jgi:hypothetical protein